VKFSALLLEWLHCHNSANKLLHHHSPDRDVLITATNISVWIGLSYSWHLEKRNIVYHY